MAALRLPEGGKPIHCCRSKRSSEHCKSCKSWWVERFQKCSEPHHAYTQFGQHKFWFGCAEDKSGQISPSSDGDDAVTTTTIGQPTPEVHKTATAGLIAITRM